MNYFLSLFSFLYNFFARRRIALYVMTFAVIVVAALILRNITMNEDIAPLLPDGENEAARDFALLQKAPFSDKILINLEAGPGTNKQHLINTADRLTKAMTGPYFTGAITGPTLPSGEAVPQWLMNALPNTFTDNDRAMVEKVLTPVEVQNRMKDLYNQLTSPEGWLLKPLLQTDPLDLRSLVVKKLMQVNVIPGMALYNNHFISSDGKNTLIIARTPVKITDSVGSKNLVEYLRALTKKLLPADIKASILSAHAYTTANAETIKADLGIILGCASAAILILILAFLRSWKGLLVFLVPSSVLCLATAGTLLIYHSVSAVTIAFGSVLLGISDDYPILVYFALSRKERDPAAVTAQVARPVLFGGITAIVTFAVMLFSNLPGQRQLAVFCIIGVAVSLIFSLVVLPHLLQGLPGEKRYFKDKPGKIFALPRKWTICCWLIIAALCLWQASHLRFNGDLKALNVVPKELKKTEEHLAKTWGSFQDKAILFSEGKDLQSSLAVNDKLFTYLSDKMAADTIISLAPILPSEITQEANRHRWKQFWAKGNLDSTKMLIADQGGKLGFSSEAFTPFFSTISQEPTPLAVKDLNVIGLGDLASSLILEEKNHTMTMTMVPDTKQIIDLIDRDPDRPKGVHLVSQGRFREIIGGALTDNFVRYIFFALAVIIVSVSILFRNVKKVLLSLLPVVTGLVLMFGAMGLMGIEFNLFNIVASVLVISLGVDLGIFMICNLSEGYEHTANLGILLGGLTSFVGLGALTLARHPAISSIGITVLLGLLGVIPSALFVIPALYGKREGP